MARSKQNYEADQKYYETTYKLQQEAYLASREIKEPKRVTDSIHNRLYSSHIEKQTKLEELIKKHKQEEESQHTFKPQIFSNTERLRFQTIETAKGKS